MGALVMLDQAREQDLHQPWDTCNDTVHLVKTHISVHLHGPTWATPSKAFYALLSTDQSNLQCSASKFTWRKIQRLYDLPTDAATKWRSCHASAKYAWPSYSCDKLPISKVFKPCILCPSAECLCLWSQPIQGFDLSRPVKGLYEYNSRVLESDSDWHSPFGAGWSKLSWFGRLYPTRQ